MDLGIGGCSFRSNGSFRSIVVDGFSRSSLSLGFKIGGCSFRSNDILKLGFQDRKNLIEMLLHVAEQDNEKFLLKLQNRIDR